MKLAGPEGIEPPPEVLETSVLPLNYGPSLIFRTPATQSFISAFFAEKPDLC